GISPEAIAALQARPWPGNIRELANAVERAVILSRGRTLGPGDFVEDGFRAAPAAPTGTPAAPQPGAPTATDPAASAPIPAAEAEIFDLDRLEGMAIERALAATGGNRTRAAKLLGISERTLRNKLNVPKKAKAGP
ncbi:MAG: helix-turn-helix domain-containing protein, partial [Gemmatimonadales bacterium]